MLISYSDVCDDGEEFADAFGQILLVRQEAYHLAGVVLYELFKRFKLNLNPAKVINPNTYMGVHLRSSIDAIKVGSRHSEGIVKTQNGLLTFYVCIGKLDDIRAAS